MNRVHKTIPPDARRSFLFGKSFFARPLFLFLLPVFFVFHGYVGNARYLSFRDCLPLIGVFSAVALALYFMFYLFLRNSIKAALVASFVLTFYLYFGYLHDFLRHHSIFLHRYSVLLPVFLGLTAGLTLFLRRRAPNERLSLYLTVLLLSYLLVDAVTLIWRTSGQQHTAPTESSVLPGRHIRCDTCSQPDIYLLIFDEYAGSRTLRERYHYDNSGLDSFLLSEGFHIQTNSRSNYFITPFSMASMLNLSYLKGIAHPQELQPDDYTDIFDPIRKNEAVRFLIAQGYTIVNNSPFDLPGHPSMIDQPFIAVKTKLITYHTLADYLVRDLGAWINDHLHSSGALLETAIGQVDRMNTNFLARTLEESGRHPDRPRFIYTHVMMPHAPFLFDSAFHRRSEEQIGNADNLSAPDHYLQYLPYTNAHIRKVITAIRKNSGGKAVILFMSDHGYRFWPDSIPRLNFFSNQNAVFYPDRDYSRLYDSISNVNQFRVVFNKLFHLNLPLLSDSTIFLLDKR
jgi:hypothetical protein